MVEFDIMTERIKRCNGLVEIKFGRREESTTFFRTKVVSQEVVISEQVVTKLRSK